MIKVIGVRFRTAGKVYYFDPVAFEIKKGDHVIVETARGIEFGTVVAPPKEVEDSKVIQPLKSVLRLATEKDMEQEASNKIKEREAFKVCLEKIHKHELDMKLIDAEYTFDNNKVLFYFTADGRIDFRELVKDLASVFKTRIELRQIGVRDETKIVGGMGICGRPLCCHTHLTDFAPVSIKMAKEQNLSLNPTKISGVCGRLMCCLSHEEETYEELNSNLPNPGDSVVTDEGLRGEVQSVSVLRQQVKVIVEVNGEKEVREYKVAQLQFKRKHGKNSKNQEATEEELKELEKLEKIEKMEKASASEQPEKEQKNSDRNGERRTDRNGERNNRNNSRNGEKANDRGGERRDKPFKGDRPNQGNRNNRPNAQNPENRSERPNGQNQEKRSERPNGQNQEKRSERPNGQNSEKRSERPNTQNLEKRNERPNGSNRRDKNSRHGRNDRRNDRPNTQGES